MNIENDVVPCQIADHELISSCINIKKPKRLPETKTYRCLENYTPDILCNLILERTPALNEILNTDNIDIQVPIITKIMNECIDNCAPVLTKQMIRPPAPWIDQGIKLAMK